MFELQTGGGHSWLEAGEGAPLVLVHGIGGTTANWAPVVEPLAQSHHVLAWSFPGYDGAQPLPDETPMADHYAARLLDFLDQRGIGPAHVVGHSLGAVVVAALAGMAPEKVSRLSFICPVIGAGQMPDTTRAAMRQGRLTEIRTEGMKTFAEARTGSIVGPSVTPEALGEIIATMAGIPEAAYLQAWDMLCASCVLEMLDPGAFPVLVAGGEVDPVAPPDAVMRMAETLAVAPVILPGIGHFPTYEARDDLIALILRP